ncbi:MAG: hypothetical protein ACRDTH_06720 [Pseudonocardiaceae bacterium]
MLTQTIPDVVRVPPTFRFTDANPLSGRTYVASLFRDLPEYAADAVTDVLGLRPREWDGLVRCGEAGEVADMQRRYSVGPWLAGERWRRQNCDRPPWVCTDCWGTCVVIDLDGSVTGEVGSTVVCTCTEVWTWSS